MCKTTPQSHVLARSHWTLETEGAAAATLNALSAELVQLVQARTGLAATAEHTGNEIRFVPTGGVALGEVATWFSERVRDADPWCLAVRWFLSPGPGGVELRAELWHVAKKELEK